MSKQDGSGRMVSADSVDDSDATILHVDMDAFFASVELLDRPDLRGLPVIVGHRGARSVVTAATYEARKYGVNSAMPMAVALRRCPNAIVLEPHMDRYRDASRRVMAIFDDMTPIVEKLSIDEAFLDVSGARRLLGGPATIGRLIRARVFDELGLTCSVGAASTKFVAKLASSKAKPDGLLVVPAEATRRFLDPLPVGALWGVGAATEETLRSRGLHTVADVAATPLARLCTIVGDAGGRRLHDLSRGVDPRSVDPLGAEKSIGHENTFENDVVDPDVLRREVLHQADRVAARLRLAGMRCRTVAIKLRFEDFSTITRSHTVADPTDVGRIIFDEAIALVRAANPANRPIRLVGVRAEQLVDPASLSVSLWNDEGTNDEGEWREAELVADTVAARFGRRLVGPASLLSRPTKVVGIDASDKVAQREADRREREQTPPQ